MRSFYVAIVFGVFLVGLTVSCGGGSPADDVSSVLTAPAAVDQPPSPQDGAWLATVQTRLSTGEYRFSPQGDRYHAVNRTQGLRFFAGADGRFTIEPREKDAALSPVILETARVSQGGSFQMLGDPLLAPGACRDGSRIGGDGNCLMRLDRRYDGMTEWFDNREEGIEQGFDITAPLSGVDGILTVAVRVVTGDARMQGDTVILSSEGTDIAQVHTVKVLDAAGAVREGSVELLGDTILFSADVTGLAYPLTLDPLYSGTNDRMLEADQANARFGFSVSTAGDVNGDNYSDIVVGTPLYDNGQTDEGAVFIYHGSATGIGTAAARMLESNQFNAQFGASVSTAGDVNGDGYGDIIIGAHLYDNGQTDEGAVFIYHGSASGIGTAPARMLESDQPYAAFGISVATAGDVNSDNYSDIVVGSSYYDNGHTDEGAAFVYYGSASGIGASYARRLESNQIGAEFGYAVASAGDVNGDGYSDIIVGAYAYDNSETDEGAAFIFHGSATGIGTTHNRILVSAQANAYFGISVAPAGDVNGDGYGDILVGAHYYDNGQTDEGAAFLYHGSVSGIGTVADRTIEVDQANARFGISVAPAGDTNGDGYGDIVIGAYHYDNGQTDEGAVFLYHGSPWGVTSGYARMLESNQAYAYFGVSVAPAGDVNGDGYSDIVVGAYYYDNGQTDEGTVFIYHGAASGIGTSYQQSLEIDKTIARFGYALASAGDVNGDGYSDILVGVPYYDNGQTEEGAIFIYHGSSLGLGVSYVRMFESDQTGALFGYSVAPAGDVNGDGYSDIIVGCPSYDNGEADEGVAFIYHGSASGIGASYARRLESDQVSAQFGISVASAGDVNGDAFSDIIVGSNLYDNGQNNEGAAFIYHGSMSGIGASYTRRIESDQANAQFGYSVAPAGDINGDGYSDIVIGAPYYDNGETDEGAVFIYRGSETGIDPITVQMLESNQATARFGWSVVSAGDVNGDIYSDIIVGAYLYDNGQADEGAAFIYHGSVSGITLTPARTLESNQVSARFGWSVASAGDVNGDNYSDIIIGASTYDNGQSDEGAAFIYHGSATGIGATYSRLLESGQADAYLGWAVASAGDVNGDGYSDVIVSATYYDNGQSNEGLVFLYLGNNGGGKPFQGMQRSHLNSPLQPLAKIPRIEGFTARANALSFMGRSKAKMLCEVKPQLTPFDNTSLRKSTAWTGTGTGGTAISEPMGNLTLGRYHWRLRFQFTDGTLSRWFPFDRSLRVWQPDLRVMLANGDPCALGTECASNFCIDGVCCNNACGNSNDNDCQACSVTKGAPANGTCMVLGDTVPCRPAGGTCDRTEYCTGSSTTCPEDLLEPPKTVCRTAPQPCDAAEECDGFNKNCPADAVKPNTATCREADGLCDVEEKCDALNKTCPPDLYRLATHPCREADELNEPCDLTEYCTGTDPLCPADAVKEGGTSCRSIQGLCDVEEFCNGTAKLCPEDKFKLKTYACRPVIDPVATPCDATEYCPGDGPQCPDDAVKGDTVPCRAAADLCDAEEKCDGLTKTCPPDLFQPNTFECRAAPDKCDVPEYCTSFSVICPPNTYKTASEVCRESAGFCDLEEKCTGTGPLCPTDLFKSSSIECRGIQGTCDLVEYCTGGGPLCPTDLKKTTSCRSATDLCDAAEFCDGINNDCPDDGMAPALTVCREKAGACDVEEKCNGESKACPTDAFLPLNSQCHTATNACDLNAYCTGGAVCPPVNYASTNGDTCDDEDPLTKNDVCYNGVCAGEMISGICGNPLTIGSLPYFSNGTTAARPNAMTSYGAACAGASQPGSDIAYALTVKNGWTYQIQVTPAANFNAMLNLLGICGEGESCLGAANGGGDGETETILFTAEMNGTVYIVIEGANASENGAYDIAVTVLEHPDDDSIPDDENPDDENPDDENPDGENPDDEISDTDEPVTPDGDSKSDTDKPANPDDTTSDTDKPANPDDTTSDTDKPGDPDDETTDDEGNDDLPGTDQDPLSVDDAKIPGTPRDDGCGCSLLF